MQLANLFRIDACLSAPYAPFKVYSKPNTPEVSSIALFGVGRSEMLWDVHRNKQITRTPHRSVYAAWRSRLTADQIVSIKTEIRRRIKGDEIATAGWIPGSDWTGTPFDPIYTIACRSDGHAAGRCFGLIVWETLMESEEYWGFGRYELNNLPLESMTYFKVQPCT